LIQMPDLLALKGSYSLTLGLRLAEVREVMRLMGPRILGVAVVQVNFIVNTIIALSLPEGSVAAIALAFTWMLMPQAAVAQAVAIAAMPTFSAQAALNQIDELRSTLAGALRGVLLLAIPAAVGLILVRTALFTWIYQHGSFTARMTELAAFALFWYALGLVGHSLMEVIVRAFYALHDTRTPVAVGVGAMGLNIAFSFAFSSLFARLGWMPHGGLALANSLATTLEMGLLLVLLRRRLGGLHGGRVLAAAGRAALGALGMGIVVAVWLQMTAEKAAWLQVLGGALLGGLVYAGLLLAMRVPEPLMLLSTLGRRLGISPRPGQEGD
jgi:putative peptidoglycan lipid II flippase